MHASSRRPAPDNPSFRIRKKRAASAVSVALRWAYPRAFQTALRRLATRSSPSSSGVSRARRRDPWGAGRSKRWAQRALLLPQYGALDGIAGVSVLSSAQPLQRRSALCLPAASPLQPVGQEPVCGFAGQPGFQGVRRWREVRARTACALSLHQSMRVALGMAFRIKCTASLQEMFALSKAGGPILRGG